MRAIRTLILTISLMAGFFVYASADQKQTAKIAKPQAATSKTAAKPAPEKPMKSDYQFYRDEGAHFELPFEYWFVMGEVSMPGGTGYYGAHFHKVGDQFFHARNGYSFLRMPDGKYDYRSFGQGMVKQLAQGALKDMVKAYPDDKRYQETLDLLDAGKSAHFYELGEEERALYRGQLYIHFGKNRYYRSSKTDYQYELDLDTFSGLLNLKLASKEDPIFFDVKNSIQMGTGDIQGYAFYDLSTTGLLKSPGGAKALKGTSMAVHLFGQPGNTGNWRNEIILLKMDNGDEFFMSSYYDPDHVLTNMNSYYKPAGGMLQKDAPLKLEAIENWTSGSSRVEYPVAWKMSGSLLNGNVKALFKDSEVMLEEGVGTFWLGPCGFKGTVGKGAKTKKINGRGVCRVTGYNPATTMEKK